MDSMVHNVLVFIVSRVPEGSLMSTFGDLLVRGRMTHGMGVQQYWCNWVLLNTPRANDGALFLPLLHVLCGVNIETAWARGGGRRDEAL